jgi:pimeloyl-ACP methyl ester carboxylesterase
METTLLVGTAVLLLYAAVCGLLYLLQNRLIYLRVPETQREGAKSVRLQRGAASVKVWMHQDDLQPAVIYFGGNGDDVGASLPDLAAVFPDRAVYLVNYRGYGGSTGAPSEEALVGDAEAVYDWVRTRHERILVMGRSLGTGVATALASRRPVERLILLTPFDSLTGVAREHFPWAPVRWLLKDRYESAQRIVHVRSPVLVLVAEHDEVISRARSDALAAAIHHSLRHTVLVPGAKHDDFGLILSYRQRIRDFALARCGCGCAV